MPVLVVTVDADSGLLVQEGDAVEHGQPIGKMTRGDGLVLAPASGRIRHLQFDSPNNALVVFIKPGSDARYGSFKDSAGWVEDGQGDYWLGVETRRRGVRRAPCGRGTVAHLR